MKKYNNIITILLFFLFFLPFANAQKFIGDVQIGDSEQTHLIFLKNGKQKEGRIISIVDTELTFYSTEDETTTSHHLSDIEKVKVKGAIEERFDGKDDLSYQGLNRLLYQETGFPLKAGEIQYTTYWGIIHKIDYGVSDGFTIGTGVVYPGYFILQTKINLANKFRASRVKVGLNMNLAAKPFKEFDSFLEKDVTRWRGFIQFGLYTTFGNADRNVHVALNVIPIFNENDFFGDDGVVTLNFGGSIRVAKHWRVMYENALGGLINGDAGLFTALGLAWFNERNVFKFGIQPRSSFGFVNFPLSDVNLMHQLPIFSFSRNF